MAMTIVVSAVLVPHVDRIGHAMCLGIAATGELGAGLSLQAAACSALRMMARRGVGVEVLPIGNAMLHEDNLNYYQAFTSHGIAMFVGTDDPGFTGATLEVEVAAARAWASGSVSSGKAVARL